MLAIRSVVIIGIIVLFLLGVPPLTAQSGWKSDVILYGWFAGLDGTVGLARQQVPVEADFGDLAKNLDFAFGAHFEARSPKVSLIADVFYVNLGSDAANPRYPDNRGNGLARVVS